MKTVGQVDAIETCELEGGWGYRGALLELHAHQHGRGGHRE